MKRVVIRKSGGFYQVFDDDAIIINYLFNYKIINYRCGFPSKVINKVINTLEEKSINYFIKDENIEKDFKGKNNYEKYLIKGKSKTNINCRISNIIEKLNNMDKESLDKVLSMIEDYVYE